MDEGGHSTVIRFLRYEPDAEDSIVPRLIGAYREVFGDEPWNEWKRCYKCGLHWGRKHEGELVARSFTCINCGRQLINYWRPDEVERTILELPAKGALIYLALQGDQVVGFTWGYPLLVTGETDEEAGMPGLHDQLRRRFPEMNFFAYQNEMGVVRRLRQHGIARVLYAHRHRDFLAAGYTVGVVRTMGPPNPSVTYTWYRKRWNYQEVVQYKDGTGRVILAHSLPDLAVSQPVDTMEIRLDQPVLTGS